MATIVTVQAQGGNVKVITEMIRDDGRERFENGQVEVVDGESSVFVVHGTQSLRVIDSPAAEPAQE